ncbi:hypothetical protein GGD55_006371 [Rhizobium giardinii]|uniref:Uncharacterized protein n=1 Tax=Rhizobium giardinii TaxID=56731 RepID=A0A7W8UHS8_9HYPH|nr:hypothetical protein [Rhizobium giardinii]
MTQRPAKLETWGSAQCDLAPGLAQGRRIQSETGNLFTHPRYVSDKVGLPTRKRVSNPFAGFGVPHETGAVCSVLEKSAMRRSRPQGRAAPPIFPALRFTPLRKNRFLRAPALPVAFREP